MEIIGRVKVIGQTQQISEKFKKRDLVIVDESKAEYHQPISFQLTQDRCVLADKVSEGQEVTAKFNIRGKEYADRNTGETKYFNTLEIWAISSLVSSKPAATQDTTAMPAPSEEIDPPF